MRVNSFVPSEKIFDFNKSNEVKKNNEVGISFVNTLKEKLGEVNDDQIKANELTDKMIRGENVNVHQVMLATEEAKMSLQLAVQVRNKLLEAYQEVNRMQL
ncbi:flagellar hook-basal body complex protein FliE [Clostridium fallax]|uniref:Flagellar hook-basal body complex protein FliE n=1 Tax=Clostridium fallax TaxID=1533 RepID=A0A1M4UK60_9CLOT|nr:flagellar hook-basal body complex protein FliE [Clostridium fallax]SHE57045.1 flagellar hook-basal body complex protein FliE [Clostridium fallax]SQB07608.1 flagellar hook-basal body protein FliE [Clostridium fallax]